MYNSNFDRRPTFWSPLMILAALLVAIAGLVTTWTMYAEAESRYSKTQDIILSAQNENFSPDVQEAVKLIGLYNEIFKRMLWQIPVLMLMLYLGWIMLRDYLWRMGYSPWIINQDAETAAMSLINHLRRGDGQMWERVHGSQAKESLQLAMWYLYEAGAVIQELARTSGFKGQPKSVLLNHIGWVTKPFQVAGVCPVNNRQTRVGDLNREIQRLEALLAGKNEGVRKLDREQFDQSMLDREAAILKKEKDAADVLSDARRRAEEIAIQGRELEKRELEAKVTAQEIDTARTALRREQDGFVRLQEEMEADMKKYDAVRLEAIGLVDAQLPTVIQALAKNPALAALFAERHREAVNA